MAVEDVSHIHRLAPSPETIKVLEELLELARRGECVDVLVVWHDNRDVWRHVRSLVFRDLPRVIGVLEMCKTNLVTRALTGESMMNETDNLI